jgi:hypothetical protein
LLPRLLVLVLLLLLPRQPCGLVLDCHRVQRLRDIHHTARHPLTCDRRPSCVCLRQAAVLLHLVQRRVGGGGVLYPLLLLVQSPLVGLADAVASPPTAPAAPGRRSCWRGERAAAAPRPGRPDAAWCVPYPLACCTGCPSLPGLPLDRSTALSPDSHSGRHRCVQALAGSLPWPPPSATIHCHVTAGRGIAVRHKTMLHNQRRALLSRSPTPHRCPTPHAASQALSCA